MTNSLPTFEQMTLTGSDAEKFLQAQVTCDVTKLGLSYTPTAIVNLKGRIQFGLWLKRHGEEQFEIVTASDCMSELQAHIKKYGAFSKFEMSDPDRVSSCVVGDEPTFSVDAAQCNIQDWMTQSIRTGNYWINAQTQGLFQPQELRLHQRGGVDYDKGCYLGQEVVARIYFKSAPKAFLHRIQVKNQGQGDAPMPGNTLGDSKIQVVNAVATDDDTFEALVVARPEQLADADAMILDLPPALQASVAREA